MEKEMQKKKVDEDNERESMKNRSEVRGTTTQILATPGRLANATPKFLPKKRGRLGF
jgi:hypothetical protein